MTIKIIKESTAIKNTSEAYSEQVLLWAKIVESQGSDSNARKHKGQQRI